MTPADGRATPPRLSEAVTAGLRALRDLTHLPPELTSGDLERGLRAAAARHRRPDSRITDRQTTDRQTTDRQTTDDTAPPDPLATAAAAVRTACAHLATHDYVDAYLALLTAYDTLPAGARIPRTAPEPARSTPHHPNPQADAAAATQQQALTEQASIEQAVGILAETDDSSVEQAQAVLRRHAHRHGFVLAELAADIVAGRVEPAGLTEATPAGVDGVAEAPPG